MVVRLRLAMVTEGWTFDDREARVVEKSATMAMV